VRGPVVGVDNCCASGATAIALAAELVRQDVVDAAVAGGADVFTELNCAGLRALGVLAPRPAAPFSSERGGTSLGEGAGFVVLAERSRAAVLGAPMLAVMAGYGWSSDAYDAIAPDPSAAIARRALEAAVACAGLRPADIGYVNAHGAGTAHNDAAEAHLVRSVFGVRGVPMSSTKSSTGHLGAAAGAVEAIVALRALTEQAIPPTAGVRGGERDDIDLVVSAPRTAVTLDAVASNSFGTWGANAVLVLTRPGIGRSRPERPDQVVLTGVAPGSGAEGSVVGPDALDSALDRLPRAPTSVRRRMDPVARYAVGVSGLAVGQARPGRDVVGGDRVGVLVALPHGPHRTLDSVAAGFRAGGVRGINPARFLEASYHAAAGHITTVFGFTGPAWTTTADDGASSALMSAFLLLRAAVVDVALVVGAGPRRGHGADDGGDGGDGGMAVVLERASSATSRGVQGRLEVDGLSLRWDGGERGARARPEPWAALAELGRLASSRLLSPTTVTVQAPSGAVCEMSVKPIPERSGGRPPG
jgi:3-oxoacyl-[acyl-carrier-protein] synthase II